MARELTSPEQISSLANEIYEIDDEGKLQLSTAQHLDEIHATDAANETPYSDSGSANGINRDAVEQEDVEPKHPGSQDANSPSISDLESSKSKSISDKLVYMRYIRAMGFLNAATFLVLGVMFAFTFKFPRKSMAV